MRYAIVIILWLWPLVAQAGPWPRQPGQVYAALSSSYAQGRQYHGFYTEWGTPNGLTMGMDIGADSHGRTAKLISFIRWPVGQGRARLRYSLDAGIGRFGDLGVVRFGAAMGAGMPVFGRDSWWVLDGQLLRPAAHSAPDSQAQALWGVHVGPRPQPDFGATGGPGYARAQPCPICPKLGVQPGCARGHAPRAGAAAGPEWAAQQRGENCAMAKPLAPSYRCALSAPFRQKQAHQSPASPDRAPHPGRWCNGAYRGAWPRPR